MNRERPDLLLVFNAAGIQERLAADYAEEAGLDQFDGKDGRAYFPIDRLKGTLFRLGIVIEFHVFAAGWFDESIVADPVKTNQAGGQPCAY